LASVAKRVPVSGSWWRQGPHGADPLLLASPPASGRWQRGEVVAAIYLADEPATAWAEWYRVLAELALPPSHAMPRDLWCWRVRTRDIADLSTVEKLTEVGLSVPQPRRATWPLFQAVGEALFSEGYRGVLYPSAARADHSALCLFRDAVLVPGAEPERPQTTYRDPPAPPTGLRT
jgi:RES domain-containing protein